MKPRPLFEAIVVATLILALCACATKVKGVSLDRQTLTMAVGQEETLLAHVQPNRATNLEVSWAIDNAECATVGNDGALVTKAIGTATVTVTTKDGGFTAACALTVVPSVSLANALLMLSPGDTRTLTAVVVPESAAEGGLEWSSSNTKVAKVSPKGVVKALALGTSTILVKALDGGQSAACLLTVAAHDKGVIMGKNALALDWGRTHTLQDALPAAANQLLKWTSSNASVATIGDDGEIRAISPGRATITVTSDDGKKATYRLTVKPSTGEWLDLVDTKCREVTVALQQSRDSIARLRQSQEGQAGAAFVAAAHEAIGKMTENYSIGVRKLLISYRTGRKRELMEGLADFHRMAASEMRTAANGYQDAQTGMVASGVPKSVVDSVVKAFSAPAKIIEDEALPTIRLGQ